MFGVHLRQGFHSSAQLSSSRGGVCTVLESLGQDAGGLRGSAPQGWDEDGLAGPLQVLGPHFLSDACCGVEARIAMASVRTIYTCCYMIALVRTGVKKTPLVRSTCICHL